MKNKAKQLSLFDIYDHVQSFLKEDKSKFIKLFEFFVDLSEIILLTSNPTSYAYLVHKTKSSPLASFKSHPTIDTFVFV